MSNDTRRDKSRTYEAKVQTITRRNERRRKLGAVVSVPVNTFNVKYGVN